MQAKISKNYMTEHENFFKTIKVNKKFVSEVPIEEIAKWTPRNPILIDAPTGSGKNTFILKHCIPRAKEDGKNCLIISNRIAVSTQQKIIYLKKADPHKLETMTERGLIEEENFGNLKIITYHRLKSFIEEPSNKSWIKDLKYVVMDETHFFVADALFNEFSGWNLEMIAKEFSHCMRIYMTATPWDVMHPIWEAEKKFYPSLRYRYSSSYSLDQQLSEHLCLHYHFPRDFSNYAINFITKLDDLKPIINQNLDEKWLIFIDNKTKGAEFAASVKAAYIDAEKKSGNLWKEIMEKENFSDRILVSTSVLDCGVNLKDDSLRNIAIFTESRTSMIQMLGRKRCGDGESVNLWIYNIEKEDAQKKLDQYRKLYSWYDKYDACTDYADLKELERTLWRETNPSARKLFYIAGTLQQNSIARYALDLKIDFFESIADGKKSFPEYVYDWLGQERKPIESKYDKLISFCDKYLDKVLSENECSTLRRLIVLAYREAGFNEPQKSRLDELKERALNNRLNSLEIPYNIANLEQKWILHRKVKEDI